MEAWLQIKGVPGGDQPRRAWKSGMAKAITMAVKDVHLALVQRASGAKEAWDSLKRVHVQAGYARRLQLRAGAPSARTAGSRCRHFARMYALNDELIACGSKPDDEEVVMLLETCPRSRAYASTIAALTVMSTRDMKPPRLTRS
jgi:hypothetical protein